MSNKADEAIESAAVAIDSINHYEESPTISIAIALSLLAIAASIRDLSKTYNLGKEEE